MISFKRMCRNIKWAIFNHPPIGITDGVAKGTVCDYCGGSWSLWVQLEDYCICAKCKKKVYDKVLKGEKSNGDN